MKQALKDLIDIYDLYASLYALAPNGTIEQNVAFGDSVFEDTETEFKRRMQLAVAGYLKAEAVLAWYFNVSEEDALDMIPGIETE